jgi:hypothetical protein
MMSLRNAAAVCLAAGLSMMQPAMAQTTTDPMGGPLVTGAPFAADALTTVTQTLGDGTRIEQRVTAKFYRDTAGRVRREQTVIGLDALTPGTPARTMITFDSVPSDPMPYVIDPVARTARRMPRLSFAATTYFAGGLAANRLGFRLRDSPDADRLREAGRALNQLSLNLDKLAGSQLQLSGSAPIPPDVRPTEEQLGTRQIEGVKATGRRMTAVIPVDRVGNDRPITITDERWESPELRLVVYSRFSDPRTGVVEYKLTGINRSEPRADLFTLPPDYTVAPGLGLRTGGGGAAAPAGGGARGRGIAPQ